MSCSPSNLFADVTLWIVPGISGNIAKSYQNLSDGDTYDCALTSVPCESNLVKALISSNPTLVFWFDLVVVYILLTSLVIIGIIGNIFNIIIFSTNNIAADSTNNLLLGLSVSDLMSLVSIGVTITCCYLCFLDEVTALSAFNIILPHMSMVSRSFTLLSLDFVTVISIQRAVAVVLPFKLSTIFSNRNTNIVIATLVLLCVTMMISMHVSYQPVWIYHPYFRQVISLGYNHRFGFKTAGYLVTYYFIYHSAVDLVLISITGSLTVFKLKVHAKNRLLLKADKSTSLEATAGAKTSTKETKVIKMSLAVCFVTFIMCSVAITVNGMTQLYFEELFRSPISSSTEYGLIVIASINSSFNFFLYLKMSDKYRDILRNCFTCRGNE